jgi:hypothetical protein
LEQALVESDFVIGKVTGTIDARTVIDQVIAGQLEKRNNNLSAYTGCGLSAIEELKSDDVEGSVMQHH